jgi:hypothetical protein
MIRTYPKGLGIIAAATMAAGAAISWPGRTEKTAEPQSALLHQKDLPAQVDSQKQEASIVVGVASAVGEGTVEGAFRGNGRDRMEVTIRNKTEDSLRVQFSAGQMFKSGSVAVVVLRDREVAVPAGKTTSDELHTAAISSDHAIRTAQYTLSSFSIPELTDLIKYIQQHPEVTTGAAQTAILAITENLPLAAFAKFTLVGSDLPTRFNKSPFKVEVADIISALGVLREIGYPEQRLALTIDPQLKIEAMIDPLAHAMAMRYYGIDAEREWEYWKHELLEGDISTRHYALYGIARFYPDIALQMLPKWVRETRTTPAYRLSAIQALAETHRQQALPILRQFAYEYGAQTEIGKAARTASEYLDARLTQRNSPKVAVAFRASKALSQF